MGSILTVPILDVQSHVEENEEYKVVLHSVQGYRDAMEDSHIVKLGIEKLPGWSFFGVFDGHAGEMCSKYASETIFKLMFENENFITAAKSADNAQPDNNYSKGYSKLGEEQNNESSVLGDKDSDEGNRRNLFENFKNCIVEIYKDLDKKFKSEHVDNRSGSTSTCVLISPKTYYFINLGDSRTALFTANGSTKNDDSIVFQTKDHKPDDVEEKQRVLDAGGEVGQGRIDHQLAVSRAFGDFIYKTGDLPAEKQKVSVIPDVSAVPRDITHTGIVCACDGLWDVYETEEIANYFNLFQKGCPDISAFNRKLLWSSIRSKDNVSVISIEFKKRSSNLYESSTQEAKYVENAENHIKNQYLSYVTKYLTTVDVEQLVDKPKNTLCEAIKIADEFVRVYDDEEIAENIAFGNFIHHTRVAPNIPIEKQLNFIEQSEFYQQGLQNAECKVPKVYSRIFYEDIVTYAENQLYAKLKTATEDSA